ncbi:hypothetical protein [Haladaptatus halobius]|uniref:hypothetical protein n=1 Tax=Haladaptatus halobius TaxID=2884875 RepID=UPI001D0B259E|nr:hypothetical protein [Haladaptatus halobius]
MGDLSRWHSLTQSFQNFVDYYRGTNISYAAITVSTILFGVNGFFSPVWIRFFLGGGAVTIFSLSVIYKYWEGKPFGVSVDTTPSHLVDGNRQPDKMGERRDIALIQNGEVLLHGNVLLSRFSDQFVLNIDSSEDINAELRAIPRSEHDYNPRTNVLKCDNVTEYEFPITIEVFPNRSVAEGGRYFWLEISDGRSSRLLEKFDVINVDP